MKSFSAIKGRLVRTRARALSRSISGAALLALLCAGRSAAASTFEGLDFEGIVAAFEGKDTPSPKLLEGVKSIYCKDISRKKKDLRALLALLDDNFSRLKEGSLAVYEIIDELPGSAPASVTIERWRVVKKTASSVTVVIADSGGAERTQRYSKEAFVPRIFIGEKRPMSCLILENFFGDQHQGTEYREGKAFQTIRYARSGLGGVAGNETVARGVPFSLLSSNVVVSSQPSSKQRTTNLIEFRW